MQTVRKYRKSGDGEEMSIVIELEKAPKPSFVVPPQRDHPSFMVHNIEDDDEDPLKYDRLPVMAFNMDWMEGPEEVVKQEKPFDSYLLPPAIIRLGKEQKADLKTAFDLFDDGSGLMLVGDLDVALHGLGLHLAKTVVNQMVKAVEPTKSGHLCFSEFVRIFETEMCKKETREDITGCFHHFDRDGTGKVSIDNLRDVGMSIGEYMAEVEAQDMISGADRDGDGKVDFDEFRKVIQRTTIIPPRPKRKY